MKTKIKKVIFDPRVAPDQKFSKAQLSSFSQEKVESYF
jgi:hypothetical protein